ncbi:glycosyltransferase family 4 protein [Martelella lutilitoris]|uniref:Glycosyltransferase family 4 protein n=1 Tax=Martelella lutilitoris TaxID=2583532 RepID=A0A5C4JSU1_9HYPH|nr:glycosyltransferase family 1 protein [Martelella lutilitoris]TNB48473.1 glycosyltransferase family 4 protein [Martelella lutilitoris]
MNLLVDGVFFQVADTGIARVWRALLPRLAAFPEFDITVLDRGRCPLISGITYVDFPSHTFTSTAADSLLIQEFAEKYKADVFVSTYFTTPTRVPTVLIVHDMIPEVFDFDLSQRGWQEKETAICFAQYYLCVSNNTRRDLLRLYPEISPERVSVAHCGVDSDVFYERSRQDILRFRDKYEIAENYCILVGSREQIHGYKNAGLLFEALKEEGRTPGGSSIESFPALQILCVGGEPEIQPHFAAGLRAGITAKRLELSDDELACAYSGARALVYPSLYEGFGLPVVEAMSCGCPVITTPHGSLEEVAGDAALFVSGRDPAELIDALRVVGNPSNQVSLKERGIEHASRFDWDRMAEELRQLIHKAEGERASPAMAGFFGEWDRLRRIQADVDASL